MKLKCINWSKRTAWKNTNIYMSGYKKTNVPVSVIIKNFKIPIYIEPSENITLDSFKNYLLSKDIFPYSIKEQEKYTLYGHKKIRVFEVKFCSEYEYYKLKKIPEDRKYFYKIHEDDVDVLVKFITERDISFCGFVEIKNYIEISKNCFEVDYFNIYPSTEFFEIFPKILFFDLECEMITQEHESSNIIFQISMIFVENKETLKTYLLSLYECNNIDNVNIIKCKSEKILICKFIELLKHEDPLIISGFNICQYDWRKIFDVCKRSEELSKLIIEMTSRTCDIDSKIEEKQWDTKGFGKKDFSLLSMEGRSNIDVMQHVMRNYKLSSYKLNNIAKNFLKDEKKDVDYKVIFCISKFARSMYKNISLDEIKILSKKILYPWINFSQVKQLYSRINSNKYSSEEIFDFIKEPITEIGRYCIYDSILCWKLYDELQIQIACEEISNITNIPIDYVLNRGNQIRVFNLLFKSSRSCNIILTKHSGWYERQNNNISELSGAYVVEPKIGYHYGVLCEDFEALYPSIIINDNLCYTTLCDKSIESSKEFKTKEGIFYIEKERRGLLPNLCENLISERKKLKKDMKKYQKDDFKYKILDCRQLAIKVTANSIYGFTATKKGYRPLLPIGSWITNKGKELLHITIEKVTDLGFEVIYGDTDSTMIKIPPSVMNDKKTFLKCLKNSDRLEDNEIVKRIIPSIEYNLTNPNFFYQRIQKIGEELSKILSEHINKTTNSNFNLEYECGFMRYLLLKKKKYIGLLYNDELKSRGVLTVKRDYSEVEKNIYNSCINSLFTDIDIVNTYNEQILNIFTDRSVDNSMNYILTKSFRSLKFYADHWIKEKSFIDKDGNTFTTTDEFDPRYSFEKLPVNAKVALKMYNRNEPIANHSRVEYVFCRPYLHDYDKNVLKGDGAEEYTYFFKNRIFYKLDRLQYIQRTQKPIEQIFDVLGLKPRTTLSIEESKNKMLIHFKCNEYNLIKLCRIYLNQNDKIFRLECQLINSEYVLEKIRKKYKLRKNMRRNEKTYPYEIINIHMNFRKVLNQIEE